jgi:hypothetical protein
VKEYCINTPNGKIVGPNTKPIDPPTEKVFCDACGKECIPEGMTTGYGQTAEGKIHCFACCAEDDKAQMDRDGKIWLYLKHEPFFQNVLGRVSSTANGTVSNWPGTLTFSCWVKKGCHNIAGTRYDVWFKDHNGDPWYGVQYGEFTQICRCRKVRKGK